MDSTTFFTVLRLVWMILYFYVIITRHVLKAAAQVIRDRNQSPCSVRHSDNPENVRIWHYTTSRDCYQRQVVQVSIKIDQVPEMIINQEHLNRKGQTCKSSCGREQRHRQGWHRHVPVGFGFYLVIAISLYNQVVQQQLLNNSVDSFASIVDTLLMKSHFM